MQQDQFSNCIIPINGEEIIVVKKTNGDEFSNPILNPNDLYKKTQKVESARIEINEKPKDISVDNQYGNTYWFISILLLIVLLLAKIKYTFPKISKNVLATTFIPNKVNELIKTRSKRNQVCYRFLNVLSFIVLPVYVFEIAFLFNPLRSGNLDDFLRIMTVVTGIILLKVLISNFCGYVFNSKKEAELYKFNVLLAWKNLGIFLIPFIIAMPYIPEETLSYVRYVSFFLVGIVYLITLFRGFKIILQKHFSILYMILYLCALEIVPIIFLIKYLRM
ncbi:MAG: DUF4271 domain-containing protein [Marinifilaceae bacterium]|jgi:hypothetical protein|nr:DUF4271 domain-containing protein [Marinifilaceae bacterium]